MNAFRLAPLCLALAALPAVAADPRCDLPGVLIAEDPADAATDQHDIRTIHVSQNADYNGDIVFTMKVTDLSTVPAQSQWHVEFKTADNARYSVYMDSFNPAGIQYFVGDVTVDDTGVTNYGGNSQAIPGLYTPDGTIRMSVPRSMIGDPDDDSLLSAVGGIAFQQAGVLLARLDQTGTGTYTIASTATCGTPPEDVCVDPGLTILRDPQGDIFSGIAPPQQNSPGYDVRRLSIVQPDWTSGDFKLKFVLKTEGLDTVPPSTTWPVSFCSPAFTNCTDVNAAVSATNKYYTARMVSPGSNNPGSAPVFQLLKPNAADTTRATITAEPESTFNADGTISIVVKASDIGLTGAAQRIHSFLTRVQAGAVTPDNMPDGLAGAGEFFTVTPEHCPNVAPVASLQGAPDPVDPEVDVTFTISATDANGEALRFTLEFGDGQSVDNQALGAPTATRTHRYAVGGTYVAKLTVKDPRGATTIAEDSITVNNINVKPRAVAAYQGNGLEGTVVTLDASGSTDPNGDTITYTWSQLSGPQDVTLLPNANVAKPTFTVPEVCGDKPAVFKVVVSDGLLTDEKEITINFDNLNTAPAADAGDDFSVAQGAGVLLSADRTVDPDCEDLTYEWVQTGTGPTVTLTDATSATPSFTAPTVTSPTRLRFQVTVSDESGGVGTDEIVVTVTQEVAQTYEGNTGVGGLPPGQLLWLGLLALLRGPRRRRA